MPDQDDSQLIKAGRFAALGTEFGVTIVAGVVAGYYLDLWLGTGPLFILVVSMAAFAGSIYRMVAMLKRYK
jgi:F0F1-type ATP synthase assembly protein I